MNTIKLTTISVHKNTIRYEFTVSESLRPFFSDQPFWIEYSCDIEQVPRAIAAVPFVSCVLPIVWLTDAKLFLDELDKDFYECIEFVKNGYETMYPESSFKGGVCVGNVVQSLQKGNKAVAMLYSAGLDSINTLYMHQKERPLLVSLWGSDIRYDNNEGWMQLQSAITEATERFKLSEATIHSTFREFDSEKELSHTFSETLRDGWWHGVKHGLALLGHVAPLAYVFRLEKLYIASSHCREDGPVRCASNPLIDNHVRFAGCQVIHDGFEFSRQDKVKNIIDYSERNNDYLPMHVCWETQTGQNCCHCEKCYRTIAGILVENGNPAQYGFNGFEKYLDDMVSIVSTKKDGILQRQWTKIQNRLHINKQRIVKTPYWKYIRWIENADFSNPDSITEPLWLRIKKAQGIRAKLSNFRFYQRLHEWKNRLK